jgi:hypothetical protein
MNGFGMREDTIPDDWNCVYVVSRWDDCGAREGFRPYVCAAYDNSPDYPHCTPADARGQSKKDKNQAFF